MIATVSIARTSLGLGPLVLTGDGEPPYSLTESGLGRPAITARTEFATSQWLDGSTPIGATKEHSSLPLEVLVQATTAAGLDQLVDELDAALWQFAYATTVTVGGVAKVWQSSPASWSVASGQTMHAHAAEFFEVLTISIPVYPIPGS